MPTPFKVLQRRTHLSHKAGACVCTPPLVYACDERLGASRVGVHGVPSYFRAVFRSGHGGQWGSAFKENYIVLLVQGRVTQ